MEEPKIYISRITDAADGSSSIGEETDVMSAMPGIQYVSATGIDSYGAPSIYSEKYAEGKATDIYTSSYPSETKVKITLLFTSPGTSSGDAVASIAYVISQYEKFIALVSAGRIVYRDNIRRRKLILVLSEAPSTVKDYISGTVAKQAEFTFTNPYGRPFAEDEDITGIL